MKRLILICLAFAAALCGAFLIYRRRSRTQGRAPSIPQPSPLPAAEAPTPPDGGSSIDKLVPAAYSVPEAIPDAATESPPVPSAFSDPAPAAGSPESPVPFSFDNSAPDLRPEAESWMEALRGAMEKSPRELGYEKPAWTAPLLRRYLSEAQGTEVSVPGLRAALKELGYQWEHTRYVQVHPVK